MTDIRLWIGPFVAMVLAIVAIITGIHAVSVAALSAAFFGLGYSLGANAEAARTLRILEEMDR